MPISYEHQTIFVHIPKTGGSSIERLLDMNSTDHLYSSVGPIELIHLTGSEIRSFAPDLWQRYFKFAIVRNPWDRLVSEFHMLANHFPYFEDYEIDFDATLQTKIELLLARHRLTFKEFVHKISKIDPYSLQHRRRTHLLSQHQFIYDGDELLVDYVGRFEQFAQEAASIQQRFRIEKEIPRINASKHRHYQEYYDDETCSIVGELYKKDIELFGYEF